MSFSLNALIYLILLCGSVLEEKEQLRLIMNMENVANLPKNYRSSNLPMSGSAQFSRQSLEKVMQTIGLPAKQILIVDLREESHGFLNGNAVSWYFDFSNWGNQNLIQNEILALEKNLLQSAVKQKLIKIYPSKLSWFPLPFYVRSAETESELATSLGLHYVRLPVADHCRPTDFVIDQFIILFKSLPTNIWIHFHCAGGKGRTSTFMVMYDCLLNASSDSFEEILKRQTLLSNYDLKEMPRKPWKTPFQQERLAFIREFYLYCHTFPHQEISWFDWIALRKKF